MNICIDNICTENKKKKMVHFAENDQNVVEDLSDRNGQP